MKSTLKMTNIDMFMYFLNLLMSFLRFLYLFQPIQSCLLKSVAIRRPTKPPPTEPPRTELPRTERTASSTCGSTGSAFGWRSKAVGSSWTICSTAIRCWARSAIRSSTTIRGCFWTSWFRGWSETWVGCSRRLLTTCSGRPRLMRCFPRRSDEEDFGEVDGGGPSWTRTAGECLTLACLIVIYVVFVYVQFMKK